MTVHFFTFGDITAGSSRQRAFRVVDELRARGLSCVIHWPPVVLIARTPWPKKLMLILATVRSLFSIRKGDIVYLQRATYSKYFFVIMVVYLKIFRRKMIFDFDDPIYTHSFLKTKIFTQMADAVIVCTHGQAAWARQYNSDVHIVHIAVDHHAYEKFTKDHGHATPPYVIGWTGHGPEHLRNLSLLVPVFKALLKKSTVPFTFTLIGALYSKDVRALFDAIEGLQVRYIESLDWKDTEAMPREIQTFDIGVLPHVTGGEWNASKTSLKDLEYMACGVPAVCSSFGELPYVITNGDTGFLVSSTDEWVETLCTLLSDRSLRERVGRAGQQHVREHYSFDVIVPQIIAVLRSVS